MPRRFVLPLTAVLGVQLLLALLLFLRHDPLAAKTSDTPLVAATAVKDADQVVIEGKPAAGATPDSARVTFAKKDGNWVLSSAYDAPADAARFKGLLDRLAGLKRGLPIATSESAMRRFKVVDSDFERKVVLSAAGKVLDTVYFGSSPGLRKSDARSSADRAVYAVDLPTYELATDLASWLSPELLRSDTDKLAGLEIARGAERIQLQRKTAEAPASAAAPPAAASPSSSSPPAGGSPPAAIAAAGAASWAVTPALPADQHLDASHVQTLVDDVQQLRVEAVLGTTAKPEWQQDHPALALKLQDEKAQSIDWTLSKPATGDFYVLKSSAHPWYFSVSGALGKQLIDASTRDTLIVADKAAHKPTAAKS